MGLRAELTVIPGLVDPASGRPLPDLPSTGAVEDFLKSTGVADTAVAAALRVVLAAAAQQTAEGLGWWDAIRRFFAPEIHTVVAESEQTVVLDGYWVTLPATAGASAKLTVTMGSSEETSASFMIAGMGGGPTFLLDLKEGVSRPADRCERIVLLTTGRFQKVEVTQNGAVIGAYPRLVALDLANLGWDFEPATPPSAATLGDPITTRDFDLTKVAGSATRSVEIGRGTTWEMSAGLELAGLGGIKAKLSAKATYRRDVAIECKLPAGHHYLAARYEGFPAWLWSLI